MQFIMYECDLCKYSNKDRDKFKGFHLKSTILQTTIVNDAKSIYVCYGCFETIGKSYSNDLTRC